MSSVLWGQDREDVALKEYQVQFQASHTNVELAKLGLKLHPAYHFLGASADAPGKYDCHGIFLVEIKYPFKHKDIESLQECCNDRTFCLDENDCLKKSTRYMARVQTQMSVYQIEACHFVVLGPKYLKAIIINFDNNFHQSIQKLVEFYHKVLVKELVT